MKIIKAKCDECSTEFEVKEKIRQQGDLQIHYFRCTSCNHVYVSLVADSKLRKLIAKQNLLTGFMKNKALKEAIAYSKQADLKSKIDIKALANLK